MFEHGFQSLLSGPLNLFVPLDNSGSMDRADRVSIWFGGTESRVRRFS